MKQLIFVFLRLLPLPRAIQCKYIKNKIKTSLPTVVPVSSLSFLLMQHITS